MDYSVGQLIIWLPEMHLARMYEFLQNCKVAKFLNLEGAVKEI